MQHRHDYVEVEHSPPSKATSRAVGVAAGSDGGASGADGGAVVPLLLGRSGQHVPVAGETGQMDPTQVRVGTGVGVLVEFIFFVAQLVGRSG
jgi:hypothetical protein